MLRSEFAVKMETLEPASVNALAVLFLAVMVGVSFVGSKVGAVLAVLLTAVFITMGQVVVVGGAHFYFLRLVLVSAWVRVVAKEEARGQKLESMDKLFLGWVAFSFVMGFVPKPRHPAAVMPPLGIVETLINRGGFAFDALGSYFLVRHLVRGTNAVTSLIRGLACASLLLGLFMLAEKSTGRNLFSMLGGVPEFTGIRDGRLRCQGPFTHPIHAGCFGAVVVPLCVGLWGFGQRRVAGIGIVSASLVTFASASSGPLMVWIYGVGSFLFWPMRMRMRQVRRTLVATLIAAHLLMTAPVWWLIARVGDVVGGGGYWRAKLIDQFVNYVGEWWMLGTNYTAHWSPTGSGLPLYPDSMDITNQFVAEGVGGGIAKLVLFVWLFVLGFRVVGERLRKVDQPGDRERFVVWGLGCCAVAFIAVFLSVALSTQMSILFYSVLALLAGLAGGPEFASRVPASEDRSRWAGLRSATS